MQEGEIKRLEDALRTETEIRKEEVTLWNGATAPNVNRIGEMTWAKASVETVKCLLRDHYNGRLNIYDFWGIGDEREIHLGGEINEIVQFVLTDKAVYTLAGTGEKCAFTVDQKNALEGLSYYMNEPYTNEGDWEKCDMRRWLDAAYTNALSKEYDGLFKDFVIEEGIVDRFSLRSEVELFGKAIHGEDQGGQQIEYYKQTRNRIKLNGSDSAKPRWHWGRSPYSVDSCNFCGVNASGDASYGEARIACGVATFGCI